MFGHFILKQAQMTRGGAMPSGTLESPLHVWSKSPCRKFNAAPGHQENGFWKQLCSDTCIHFHPVHTNAAMHDLFSSWFEIVVAPPISWLQPAHQVLPTFHCCITTRNSVAYLCLKYWPKSLDLGLTIEVEHIYGLSGWASIRWSFRLMN